MSYPEPTVGAFIIREDGKMLLVRSPKLPGAWSVPGGHVELGESLEEALKRETKEEVNLDVEIIRFLGIQEPIYSPEYYKKKHFIFIDFLCRYVSGEPKVDGIEITKAEWFNPADAVKLELDSFTRHAIETHLAEFPANHNKPRETK